MRYLTDNYVPGPEEEEEELAQGFNPSSAQHGPSGFPWFCDRLVDIARRTADQQTLAAGKQVSILVIVAICIHSFTVTFLLDLL